MSKRQEEWIRAFIAVPIPEDLRGTLARVQGKLRLVGARVSWVRPENIHLTFIFLGDIPVSRVPAVIEHMDGVVGSYETFSFRVEGVGYFGSARHPRVLWAGLPEPPAPLFAMQTTLADALRDKGFEVERRAYRPHVTLGRVRAAAGADALTAATASVNNAAIGVVSVQSVRLVRSHLEAQGARYEVLHQTVLKGAQEHVP